MSRLPEDGENYSDFTFGGVFNTPAKLSLGGRPFFVHKATIGDLGRLEAAYKSSIPDPIDLVCSIAKTLNPSASKDFLVNAAPLVIERTLKTISLSDDDAVTWYDTSAGRRAVIDIIAERSNKNYSKEDIDVLFSDATEEEYKAVTSWFVHGNNHESLAAQRMFDILQKKNPELFENHEGGPIDSFPKT